MKDAIVDYIEENKNRFIEELISWLKIPSISTLAENRNDVRNAALWALRKLKEIGFPQVELIEGAGHPLVSAEWCTQKEQPTLLIYGHYDVQPVDPLQEWQHPPFEPFIENNAIYARGATDDKGQVMAVLAAIETLVKVEGELPINIKVLLEGEEEAGGEEVENYIRTHPERLQADAAFICDTQMQGIDQPSLINGLRGILYTEIHVSGAKRDLHSGSYGGVAPNPLHALCLLLARLKGEDGKIAIDSLYHSPLQVSLKESDSWQEGQEQFRKRLLAEMGVDNLVGEEEYLPQERLGVRPSLEIHGIRGGFTGEGAKTVIPAKASAKVSLRLPAGMKPDEVFGELEKAVKKNMPCGYGVSVTNLHGGEGISILPENRYIQAAAAAIASIYGREPVYMREGGSIPIAALFDSILKIPVVLMGFGLADDGAHGPNEKFSLDQFHKGIVTIADFLEKLKK